MTVIERAFAPLFHLPCWGVARGHGSFLTMEFGEPELVIREPIVAGPEVGARIRKMLARRVVYPRGQWHLWIYCCAWRATDGRRQIGDWSSKARIDRSAQFLNGQRLTSVTLNQRGARAAFAFDLGGHLETQPYDRTSEQWLLYEPTGKVLIWRADRRYSHELSTKEPVWRRAG